MSEIAAVLQFVSTRTDQLSQQSSLPDCLDTLEREGFDVDVALSELAAIDPVLSQYSNRASLLTYASSKQLSTAQQLLAHLEANYPTVLKSIQRFCLDEATEMAEVAGGRLGRLSTVLKSHFGGQSSHRREALAKIYRSNDSDSDELGRDENKPLSGKLFDAIIEKPSITSKS